MKYIIYASVGLLGLLSVSCKTQQMDEQSIAGIWQYFYRDSIFYGEQIMSNDKIWEYKEGKATMIDYYFVNDSVIVIGNDSMIYHPNGKYEFVLSRNGLTTYYWQTSINADTSLLFKGDAEMIDLYSIGFDLRKKHWLDYVSTHNDQLNATTQKNTLDINKFSFQGTPFHDSKEHIMQKFGEAKIAETNFECGFFTNDQPGGPYYRLIYEGFSFIGSDEEGFYLETVDFDKVGDAKLMYEGHDVSGQITIESFKEIFGEIVSTQFPQVPTDGSIVLLAVMTDDGIRFTFSGGRLTRFQYWTPC